MSNQNPTGKLQQPIKCRSRNHSVGLFHLFTFNPSLSPSTAAPYSFGFAFSITITLSSHSKCPKCYLRCFHWGTWWRLPSVDPCFKFSTKCFWIVLLQFSFIKRKLVSTVKLKRWLADSRCHRPYSPSKNGCRSIIPLQWRVSSSPTLTGTSFKAQWGSKLSSCPFPRLLSLVSFCSFLAVSRCWGTHSTPCLCRHVTKRKDFPALFRECSLGASWVATKKFIESGEDWD